MGSHDERRGNRGRLTALAVLVVAIAIVIAWFGKCGAGLGLGPAAPASSTNEPNPPAETSGQGTALALVVEGERCRKGNDPLGSCDALCRALVDEPIDRRIEIDATHGTHAAVEALRACLAQQGRRNLVVRAE